MQQYKKYIITLIGVSGLTLSLFWPTAAQAQISCSGPKCALIPITQDEYNRMYYEFKDQYSSDLFEDMAQAGVIANLMNAPVGTVNLTGWTVGGNLGAGYKSAEEVDIDIVGVGKVEDVTRAGVAINPRFFLGMNLGALFGQGFDPLEEDPDGLTPTPGWFSLSKFDLYVSGIKHTERINNEKGIDGVLRATVKSQGFEVRYHLVEASEIFGGPVLRFRGVSLGVGYLQSSQKITYTRPENSVDFTLDEGVTVQWIGNDLIQLKNDFTTVPVELRTGIQLLYLFNFTVGVGYAWSTGNSSLLLARFGPVVVNGDLASALNAVNSGDSFLGMTLAEDGSAPARIYYGRAGVELNLAMIKLGVEGLFTPDDYGASVALRVEF
ncbi:MAG: hypothetical protein KDK30_02185 [Leptospiraceae bacterium]|nr:hypothetical protein [Leptospiraceae bacterium]